MLQLTKKRLFIVFASVLQVMPFCVPVFSQLRVVKVADPMPEFSLPDTNGIQFSYKYGSGRVLAVTFLSVTQKRSKLAIEDVEEILKRFREKKVADFDFVGVINSKSKEEFQQWRKGKEKLSFPILLDPNHQLWGTLGIVAMPTVVIADKNDKISWIKSGYGYDFAPALKSYLGLALGIVAKDDVSKSSEVRTVSNTSDDARMKRHLRMGRMLKGKGRIKSAIMEMQKAEKLDPNSVNVALELGELYCRTGKTEDAFVLAEKAQVATRLDKSLRLLIMGWAKRQAGELDVSEKFLLESTTINPKSSRGFFELGKIYHAKGQPEKAMDAYYKALTVVFDKPLIPDFSQK